MKEPGRPLALFVFGRKVKNPKKNKQKALTFAYKRAIVKVPKLPGAAMHLFRIWGQIKPLLATIGLLALFTTPAWVGPLWHLMQNL